MLPVRQLLLAAALTLSCVAEFPALGEQGDPEEPASAGGDAKPAAGSKEGSKLLLIEPRDLGSPVSVLIPGARKTVFSAAYQGRLGARHYSREQFRKASPEGWKAFFEAGKAAAAEHLKSLKPKFVRDDDKVIQYAVITADHPLTPAVILAPNFAALFAEKLGEQLLIVIPNRSTVIVFPKFANALDQYSPTLGGLFDDAIYPASEEIFELTKDGIRVVGSFRPN